MDGERSVWLAIHYSRGLSFKFGQNLSKDKLMSYPITTGDTKYFPSAFLWGKGKKNKTTTDSKTNNKTQTTTTKKIQTKTQSHREKKGKRKFKKTQPQHQVGVNHMFARGAGGWKSSHEGVKRCSKSISPCYAANLPGSRGTG